MLRRLALAIGSMGLVVASLSGPASAATITDDTPQRSVKERPTLMSPETARRVASSADPAAAAAATGAFRVRNYNSGKCLVVQGKGNGTRAIQYTCTTLDDQYWYFIGSSTDDVELRNFNSNKCLVVQGTENNSSAFQYDCHENLADQRWQLRLDAGNHYMLANRNSWKCLVVQGGGDGAVPFQYDCHENLDDQWWYRG
ncbi:RICIN domain-containing protein [Streptomyces sp. NPDC059447]|uniref:RICIN domain-containing protein n=1 Tax=Streptomyces sp. NPDC059447 TaxID=3346834 RepID=UPI00368A8986